MSSSAARSIAPRPLLVLVVALLAAAGMTGASGARADATAAPAVEAETFALPSADGRVLADSSASGGAALLVWTNGTAATTVALPATGAVTVRARGDQCAGAPVMRLSMDGTVVATTPVPATGWTDVTFPGSWAAGSHRVELAYTNDIAGQGCDRNLWLDRVTFTPSSVAPTAVEAERMALPAAVGRAYADPAASGGSALVVWANGTASTALAAPAGGRLVVRARGDQCFGPPVMTVTVDGQAVLTATVPSTTWTDVAVPAPWPGGTRTVAVSFTNDRSGGGCDRNLRLDRVSVDPVPAPVPSRHLFGLSSQGPDQGITTAQATAASLGRHLDVVNFYQAWVWDTPLPVAELDAIAAGGARPEITWEPWDPRLGVDQPAYSLAAIAGGAYDGYITGWARAAAAYGRPLLLRFAHEMNGGWYPWSASANGGSPAAYVAAYRHVHDLFRAAGATNVSWVWCPNTVPGMPTPLSALWPGTGYVDVVGVDGYNGGSDVASMGGWQSPQQVFGATLDALRQLAPSVPVVVNETGSSEHGGDKSAWVTSLFSWLSTDPQVTGVFWFDFDIAGQADWRLATSAGSLAAARSALATW